LIFWIAAGKVLYPERLFIMITHFILVSITLTAVFIMFLVISRTLNNVVNLLIKLQYLVQKDLDLKKEIVEVRNLMAEDAAAEKDLDKTR
jgi:hypothetical protein